MANVDVVSVGVIGRDSDDVGEPFAVDCAISTRKFASSLSVLVDDDGDDIGERRI
jgi:hypothetical protein